MPDFADKAQAEYEQHFHRAMAERIKRLAETPRESATHCFECGCEIPEKRRQAVPGCEYCIKCQENMEE